MLSSESRDLVPASAWPAVMEMWLNTKNSERTQQEYAKIIEEAMAGLGDFNRITPESLARYRGLLMVRVKSGTLSTSSVALRLTALRGFLSFARVAGRCDIPQDALDLLLKSPPVNVMRPYAILDQEEIDSLISACSGARDKALVGLLVETGLRCAELVAIRLNDFHTTETGVLYLNVKHGKGDKSRSIPLSRRARQCIDAYLSETGRTLRGKLVLFKPRAGDSPLNTSRIRQIFIAARKAAGISKPVSPHSLRHTAAMRWLRASPGNIQAVGKLLGHSSLDTTKRYVDHLSLDELAQIVEV